MQGCEIWDSHSSDYEDCCLCIVLPCILLDGFRGTWCYQHILTLSRQQVLLKWKYIQYILTKLHGVTTQNKAIFKCNIVEIVILIPFRYTKKA
jgi:hypothetical protein